MFVRDQVRVQILLLSTFYEEAGSAWAQYELGKSHATGKRMNKDMTEAARLYRMEADQGDETAANHMRKLQF